MLVTHSVSSGSSGEAAVPGLRPSFGALRAVCGELHNYGGAVDWKHPLRLGLVVGGLPFLRLRERRGDSIGFDTHPLTAENFADGSRVEVHDLTDALGAGLRDAEVRSLSKITDGQGSVIGIALLRADGPPFCIWVEDDEFTWGDEAALQAATFPDGMRATIGGEVQLS